MFIFLLYKSIFKNHVTCEQVPFSFCDGEDHADVHERDGEPGRQDDEDAVHPELVSFKIFF